MNRTQIVGARLILSLCLLVLVVVAGAPSAFAQGQNAILTGTIGDNDGVIPGATVTVTDPATGLTRTAESNDRGVFRIL